MNSLKIYNSVFYFIFIFWIFVELYTHHQISLTSYPLAVTPRVLQTLQSLVTTGLLSLSKDFPILVLSSSHTANAFIFTLIFKIGSLLTLSPAITLGQVQSHLAWVIITPSQCSVFPPLVPLWPFLNTEWSYASHLISLPCSKQLSNSDREKSWNCAYKVQLCLSTH